MKVLMCAPYDTNGRFRGGITELVAGILEEKEELARNGLCIAPFELCRVHRAPESKGRLSFANIRNFLACCRALPGAARAEKYDAVYYHTSMKLGLLKDLFLVRRLKKKVKLPVAVHIHYGEFDKIFPRSRLLRALSLRLLRRYADRIFLLSHRTKEEFIAHGFSGERLSVLYNFTSLAYTASEIEEKKARIMRAEPLSLLFVGSFCARKGVADLLAALRACSLPYRLELCGEATEKDAAQLVEAASADKPDRICPIGYVSGEEKRAAYARADLLVLPSYEEGLPVVILEAYAAGCGVLSTAIAAIPEIVSEENGILVAPGDIPALAAAIEMLAADRDRLSRMAESNYASSAAYTPAGFIAQVAAELRK